jgi:hypothetical protein
MTFMFWVISSPDLCIQLFFIESCMLTYDLWPPIMYLIVMLCGPEANAFFTKAEVSAAAGPVCRPQSISLLAVDLRAES